MRSKGLPSGIYDLATGRKYKIIVLVILLFLAGFMQLIRIDLINDLVPLSPQYVSLQEQVTTVQEENEVLEDQILQKEAYTTVEEEARRAGFVPRKEVILGVDE